jgi:hypothetical protein
MSTTVEEEWHVFKDWLGARTSGRRSGVPVEVALGKSKESWTRRELGEKRLDLWRRWS